MRLVLILIFAAAALVAAIVLTPLSAALAWGGADRLGLGAAEAEGTIWRGRLRDAHYGPLRLGDVEVRLDPLALATGRLRLRTRSESGAFRGRATWTVKGRESGVEAVTGELVLAGLKTAAPLLGPLALQAVTARFAEGRCVEASGRVSATSPAGSLAGAVACRDGALRIPFVGRSLLGDTALTLTVQGDGRYRAETRVTGPDPTQAASLRLAGFADTGGVMLRIDEGRLPLR